MKVLLSIVILLAGFGAQASVLYFNGSLADGTDKFSNVNKTEFLFVEQNNSVRMCGLWLFADGSEQRFDQTWAMNGSNVVKDGKNIGTFFDGNFLIEENMGAGKHQAIEVTRSGPEYFEYHFHHPDLGFVDADGWLKPAASERLARACPL